MKKKRITLGLLGCGTVGGGLADLLRKNREHIRRSTGVDLALKRVLVTGAERQRRVDRSLLTTDPGAILDDAEIDIVVETIGGLAPAGELVAAALDRGKNVVTANKALLATRGIDLFRRARRRGLRIGFEASVCGGIPIIRAIRDGLCANRIVRLVGILNGTSNCILTRMSAGGVGFAQAVEEARQKGFCEKDPTLDISGRDAAQKLAILAGIALGAYVSDKDILVEGIEETDPDDIAFVSKLGYVVKQIAIAAREHNGLDLRVHRSLLPARHPLAGVEGEENGVVLEGDAVGGLTFIGKGAGSLPTASAVLSDIVEIARGRVGAIHLPPLDRKWERVDFEACYYLRFPVKDVPGVIGLIATALGNKGISISRVDAALVPGREGEGGVRVVTHRARESVVRRAVGEIGRLPCLTGKPHLLRFF